jgi:hypothetical protein
MCGGDPTDANRAAVPRGDSFRARRGTEPLVYSRTVSRRLVRVAGPLIVLASFFLVNGRRLLANLDEEQWEDPLSFDHVRQNIHGLTGVFTHGSYWKGLYRPLSTNLLYLVGSAFNNDLRLYHLVLLATYLVNAGLFYSLARELLPIGYATLVGVLFVTRAATVEVPLPPRSFRRCCRPPSPWPRRRSSVRG